jgi:4a-hydroxytetrahydrobiopterin dehydratase
MPIEKLNSHQISEAILGLQGWSLDADHESIAKEWVFASFKAAMGFWHQVAELAAQQNHHPEFWSNYTQLRLRLTTHDAGGLTALDFSLAKEIDRLHLDR